MTLEELLAAQTDATVIDVKGLTLAGIEREAIVSCLKRNKGSTTRAARELNISVRKVQYKLREWGVTGGKRVGASSLPLPSE